MKIESNLIDWQTKEIYAVAITIVNHVIVSIEKLDYKVESYIMPGFVDSHVHIESSLLIPSEFARMAVIHGTVATVSDPHEIANVCGKEGILYMINNGKKVPFHFCFGAPSCVPATTFETSGAVLNSKNVEEILNWPDIYYLSEVMNYPGVINDDHEVHKKIIASHTIKLPVDGHAPGLSGHLLDKYIAAGISTDHECFTYEEGYEKATKGMKILIREGSAARNFDALIPLLNEYPKQIMFCSDDKHPDSLLKGHINDLAKRALEFGCDFWDVIYAACIAPVLHYNIPSGLLRVGDSADFILIDELTNFKNPTTYINGIKVAENGHSLINQVEEKCINNFETSEKNLVDYELVFEESLSKINVIGINDGQLITTKEIYKLKNTERNFESDIKQDILKLVVVNRYHESPISIALVTRSGIKQGAIASSVAHDSHNIVAMGCNDVDICSAVNLIIRKGGGLSYANGETQEVLPLPVAGLMSNIDAWEMADAYIKLDALVKLETETTLHAPFMTLSFLALPVIPHLKLTDLGLFDVDKFGFVDLNIL